MLGNGGLLGASASENQKAEVDARSPGSARLAAINLSQRNYLGVGTASGRGEVGVAGAGTTAVRSPTPGNPNLNYKLGENGN